MTGNQYNDSKNIVPFRKADRFNVHLGDIGPDGKPLEGEKVGLAFLKPGSGTFRLKLWIAPSIQYFIAPDDNDSTKYVVLCLDEYHLPNGEVRTNWNRIGEGQVMDNFIKLKIHLLANEVMVCLFPIDQEVKEETIAS